MEKLKCTAVEARFSGHVSKYENDVFLQYPVKKKIATAQDNCRIVEGIVIHQE